MDVPSYMTGKGKGGNHEPGGKGGGPPESMMKGLRPSFLPFPPFLLSFRPSFLTFLPFLLTFLPSSPSRDERRLGHGRHAASYGHPWSNGHVPPTSPAGSPTPGVGHGQRGGGGHVDGMVSSWDDGKGMGAWDGSPLPLPIQLSSHHGPDFGWGSGLTSRGGNATATGGGGDSSMRKKKKRRRF
jgi:hypothetical protein